MQYKKIIVRIILLTAVIAGVTDLFTANPDALWAMVAVYFCIPLASLTLTTSSKARIITIASIITVLLLLLSRFKVYPLIAAAVFIGGTAYCLIQHNIRIHRRKEMTTRALAYVHSGIFALICAIAGTFSIMSKPGSFTISCDQVRGVVNEHLGTVLTPLRFTEEQIGSVQKRVDAFFTQSPEQVVQEQVMGQLTTNSAIADILPATITQKLGDQGIQDMQKMVNDMLKNSNGSQVDLSTIKLPANLSIKDKLMAKELLKNAGLNKPVPKLTIGQNTDADTTPTTQTPSQPTANTSTQATTSTSLFNGLITNSLDNKQQLDQKICDVVFGQIKEWSTKPGFKISILLSLIFFLYPLGRLIAFVYSVILTIIYIILRQTGFISVVPEEKIVDTWTIGNGYEPQTLLARMAFVNKDKTPKSERVAKVVAAQEAARNATPPRVSSPTTTKQSSNMDEILGDMEQMGGGTGATGDNHIITANSPQDTNEEETPQPKKESGPHIDFGSFGGNFGQKFKSE